MSWRCNILACAGLACVTGCSDGESAAEAESGWPDASSGEKVDEEWASGTNNIDTDSLGTQADTDTGGSFADESCNSSIELIVRDFKSSHPDFETFNGGQGEVGCGMVADDLLVEGNVRIPHFVSGSGRGKRSVDEEGIVICTDWDEYYTGPSEITSDDTFAEWYNNVEGVNLQLSYELELSPVEGGDTLVFDSKESGGFFIMDGLGFNEVTQNHNFHFTTEAHIRFEYKAGQKFTFSGDDDLWIFVNDKLALDLGGMHAPITASIDFDAQAVALGITAGQLYNMDIFHAERHTSESNFRIETNIRCFEAVEVPLVR